MTAALNADVLVLNKFHMAHKVIDAKRAFCLLIVGKAEVIDVEDKGFYNYDFASWQDLSEYKSEYEKDKYRWIKIIGGMLAVPSIIRLTTFDKYRRQEVKLNRRALFARDENVCQYCGNKFRTEELSLDHVVPRSRGGGASWTNLVASCVKCNTKKANRTPSEANMPLIREPFKPKNQLDLPRIKHWTWKQFVDAAYWETELK